MAEQEVVIGEINVNGAVVTVGLLTFLRSVYVKRNHAVWMRFVQPACGGPLVSVVFPPIVRSL